MTEKNGGPSSLNPVRGDIGSRSSHQTCTNFSPVLFKNGAHVIFEYPEGLLAFDCEWIKINSYGINGSVSFLPCHVIAIEWKGDGEFDIETELIPMKGAEVEEEFFRETLGSVYFKYKLIEEYQSEGLDIPAIGVAIAKTYYVNQQNK